MKLLDPNSTSKKRYNKKQIKATKDFNEANKKALAAYKHQWYLDNREACLQRTKYWRKANPERAKAKVKECFEKNGEQYEKNKAEKVLSKLEFLAGRPKPELCERCNRKDRICFDHCHKTNKFRGWLCHKCNTAIGLLDDNPDILDSLAEYLRNFNENNISGHREHDNEIVGQVLGLHPIQ